MIYNIELLNEKDVREYSDLLYQMNNYRKEIFANNITLDRNIFIIKDKNNKIISSAKLLIEPKLYEGVGHIEDVVTDKNHRGKGYGKMLIQYLIRKAFDEENCYKVVLSCDDKINDFYIRCGMRRTGSSFSVYKK
jgi:glucosamine-phosphate N-acetyltransferase